MSEELLSDLTPNLSSKSQNTTMKERKTLRVDDGGEVVVRVSGSGSIPLVYIETLGINETFESKLNGTNRLLEPYLEFCTAYHIAWPGSLDARPPETWESSLMVQSIEKALDGVNLGKVGILLGHSTGAVIAMEYASQQPDNVNLLVLSSPPLGYGSTSYREVVPILGKIIDSYFTKIPIQAKRKLFSRVFCTSPEVLECLSNTQMDNAVVQVWHMLTERDNLRLANALQVHTLLFSGTNDKLTPHAMFLPLNNPKVELKTFEKTRHVQTLRKIEDPATVRLLLETYRRHSL